jgi:hypothetical protein
LKAQKQFTLAAAVKAPHNSDVKKVEPAVWRKTQRAGAEGLNW